MAKEEKVIKELDVRRSRNNSRHPLFFICYKSFYLTSWETLAFSIETLCKEVKLKGAVGTSTSLEAGVIVGPILYSCVDYIQSLLLVDSY
jgi:hypothetical protein